MFVITNASPVSYRPKALKFVHVDVEFYEYTCTNLTSIVLNTADVCEQLTAPRFGSLSASSTLINTHLYARCDVGYAFTPGVFSYSLLCQQDKTWNDTVRDCLRK